MAQALDGIVRAEPGFNPAEFLEGAKSAYEMIVTAFAQGDRRTLKDLLAKEVYEGFERAITERERRGETVETTFVSIDKAEMAGAELQGKTAQIVVRFLSKLITATRDASGTVVDGSGGAPFTADVAIAGGRIVAVGRSDGRARRIIDASGLLVTPGFVDVHAHYDGQATWDRRLTPSSWHGVTTVVMGNCGVGFAPVLPAARDTLIVHSRSGFAPGTPNIAR